MYTHSTTEMISEPEAVLSILKDQLIIGTELISGHSEQLRRNVGPGPDQREFEWCSATPEDAMAALDSAARAQRSWEKSKISERVSIIERYSELLDQHSESLASLMVLETAKTITHARAEVHGAQGIISELLLAVKNGALEDDPLVTDKLSVSTRKVPVGPTLLITPWNFPLGMANKKAISALLCGCTAIIKPSERTPFTALYLGKLLIDSGLPPGVLSVIPSDDSARVVRSLLNDPRLRKVSFTGSTTVGRKVLSATTHHFQRTSLELGGNAPCIVLDDADIEASVNTIWASKIFNNGQACTAPNRLIVAESLFPSVSEMLAELASKTTVGDPRLEETDLGPVISKESRSRLMKLVNEPHGGRVIAGNVSGASSNEVAPTVVIGAQAGARVCREELFGPVLPVISYPDTDIEEALKIANETEYGLASYVFGTDSSRIEEVVAALDFGMTAVNHGNVSHPAAPFGGVKHSGFGLENGRAGLEEYLQVRAVHSTRYR